ncbi:MAG: hypothetical protein HFI57_13360 [Lachnospiraceae bacterium]|nr:hypothetical protein [Lachnospiraceae bacterium]
MSDKIKRMLKNEMQQI